MFHCWVRFLRFYLDEPPAAVNESPPAVPVAEQQQGLPVCLPW